MSQDEIGWLVVTGWVLASIVVLLRMRVFRARPLEEAPARQSLLTLATVGGVILVYIGMLAFAVVGAKAAGWIETPETHAIAAATAAGTGGVPGGAPGGAPGTGPARPSASTASSTVGATGPASRRSEPTLAETVLLQGLDAAAKLVAAGMGILLARRLVVGGLAGWGLTWRVLPRGILWGVLGYLVVLPLVYLTSSGVTDYLQWQYHRSMTVHPTITALQSHPSAWLETGLVFFAGVTAPLLEEIFFRGLLQTALLEDGWGFVPRPVADVNYRPSAGHRWGAIFVTSLVFAAVHGSVEQGVVLFVLSLGLGYVYERTGNLWASMGMHAMFNGVSLAINIFLGG